MEPTPFELTPEQKGMLATLSRETGKPIPALIAKALEELQEHERLDRPHDDLPGTPPPATPSSSVLDIFREAREGVPEETRKPFWKKVVEASLRIPDEELDRLPPDLAAQVDHYVYGTPKR